jgi:hypothetical protein
LRVYYRFIFVDSFNKCIIDIRDKNRNLERGIYNIDGEVLIIRFNFIKHVLSNKYGINDILTCQFSGGTNWKIKIILYDTPVLKESKGTIEDFYILTEFNGDSVATMETFIKMEKMQGQRIGHHLKSMDIHLFHFMTQTRLRLQKNFLMW